MYRVAIIQLLQSVGTISSHLHHARYQSAPQSLAERPSPFRSFPLFTFFWSNPSHFFPYFTNRPPPIHIFYYLSFLSKPAKHLCYLIYFIATAIKLWRLFVSLYIRFHNFSYPFTLFAQQNVRTFLPRPATNNASLLISFFVWKQRQKKHRLFLENHIAAIHVKDAL